MAQLLVTDLTETTLAGSGVFDVLMRANKVHLEEEFLKGRIKGPEYAQVYLGSMESVMRASMEFLLQRQKISLEAELLAQQVVLAQVEVTKANAQVRLMDQQVLVAQVEVIKANAQVDLLHAQVTAAGTELTKTLAEIDLVKQHTANAVAELAILNGNAGKVAAEVVQLTAQSKLTNQQAANALTENGNIVKTGEHLDKQNLLLNQQRLNLVSEEENIRAQNLLIGAQKTKTVADANAADQHTLLVKQQASNLTLESLNIPLQGAVLTAQECKLRAEYDLTLGNVTKSASENTLLLQKVATEKAQVLALGVDDNSVLGKQKSLYQAQTDGFKRDAEQKAAKLLVDSWNVRKTVDSGTDANPAGIGDAAITRVVTKLITGVGA